MSCCDYKKHFGCGKHIYEMTLHKLAAYNSMVHSVTHISLTSSSFNKQFYNIKKIVHNNGCDMDMCLNYLRKPIEKLKSVFTEANHIIAFKTNNSKIKYIKNDNVVLVISFV